MDPETRLAGEAKSDVAQQPSASATYQRSILVPLVPISAHSVGWDYDAAYFGDYRIRKFGARDYPAHNRGEAFRT